MNGPFSMKGHIQNFIGKPKRKRLPRMPRHRLEDNIKMDYIGMGSENVDSTALVQDKG